jgi:hypothetical protein
MHLVDLIWINAQANGALGRNLGLYSLYEPRRLFPFFELAVERPSDSSFTLLAH